ncbi:Rieske (2Fe-2S) protein [Sphingomonas sp.]|uniref:Rieske (2Fe-2S) protein n=1 Tax=Sphingomonas sp. TaxID=28214 RepID=UPI00375205F7
MLRLGELPATGYVRATVGAHTVLVARLGDDVFAVENRCSHAGSELSGGRLKMGRLSCPLHGAMFDFRTGASMGGTLALHGLRIFNVRVTGDEVAVADTPRPGLARAVGA